MGISLLGAAAGDPFNLTGLFGGSNGQNMPATQPYTSVAPGSGVLGTQPSNPARQFANLATVVGNDLPWLSGQQNQTILPTAQANFNAQQAITPQQLALMTQMYQQYMPGLTSSVDAITRQQQGETAANNAAISSGPQGQAALQAALQAFYQANPNFAATSNLGANSLRNLVGSIDLSGNLSGSEQQQIQRSLDQQNARNGTVNAPSATTATANAMTFGQAGYQRQEQAKSDLSNAIAQATSFLPTTRTGIDSWGVSTGTNPTGSTTPTALFGQATGTGTNQAGQATGMSGNNTGTGISSGTSIANTAAQGSTSRSVAQTQLIGGVINSLIGMGGAAAGGL